MRRALSNCLAVATVALFAANLDADELMKLDFATPVAPAGTQVHAAAGNQVGFGPAEMTITARSQTFAHLEIPVSAAACSVSCLVQADEEQPDPSWWPAMSVYWDDQHWCRVGLNGRNFVVQQLPWRRGGFNETRVIPGAEPGQYHRVWIVLGARYIYFLTGPAASQRHLLFRLQRSLFPAGAPKLVMLGKGYSDGGGYPQSHFDNSAAPDGPLVTCRFSDFVMRTSDEQEWNALDGEVLHWPSTPADLKPWVIPADEHAARQYEQAVYSGLEPTYEQVASFYPAIQYPNAIVGADGYPGKAYVAWNGDVVLPPVNENYAAKVGDGIYWRLACDWPPTSLDDRGKLRRSLRKGYLPVVTTEWELSGIAYSQRVFAARLRDDVLIVFWNLSLTNCGSETRTAHFFVSPGTLLKGWPVADPRTGSQFWSTYACPLRVQPNGVLVEQREGADRIVAAFAPLGQWHAHYQPPAEREAGADAPAPVLDNAVEYSLAVPPGETRRICIRMPFYPMPIQHEQDMLAMDEELLLAECESRWEAFLEQGLPFRVPERSIADAMKTHLINNQIITNEIDGQRIPSYGAYTYEGLLYDFESEEFLEVMDLYGNHDEARRCLEHLLELGEQSRVAPGGEYAESDGWLGFGQHNLYAFGSAGSRAICEHFRLTGDTAWLRTMAPRLLRAATWIKNARATTMRRDGAGEPMPYYGLIPRGEWCDIGEWEHWYFNSAFFYRSLRDIADVLRSVDAQEAAAIQAEVQAFREDILRSVDRSTDRHSDPPLIPLAPCVRQPYAGQQDLQANIYGHYWSIAGPNVLMFCGVVEPDDERATWILKWLEQRNGFLLGNARFGAGIDAKYGYPSMITYLRRDEITKVLLHLYGFRAYGMARDTASTPEVYLEVKTGGTNPRWWTPCLPDRFANSRFLALVRNLLVREEGDSLYLLDAAPRRWLAEGEGLDIVNAPTYFGPLSLKTAYEADSGAIHCRVRLPSRVPAARTMLRLRHPTSAVLESVTINGQPWTDFDASRERIRLPQTTEDIQVTARYK